MCGKKWYVLSGLLSLGALLLFQGCGIKKWWGEEAVAPGVINLVQSSGAECLPAEKIIQGSEKESSAAFECWVDKLSRLWIDVGGSQKDVLTDGEIRMLLENRVITVPGDISVFIRKLQAGRKLLGIPSPLKRERVNQWIERFRKHRAEIRNLYSKWMPQGVPRIMLSSREVPVIGYYDLETLFVLGAHFLREMGWSMDSEELGKELAVLLEIQDRDLLNAFVPFLNVAVNVVDTFCPSQGIKDRWDTALLSKCLVDITKHFEPGAPWFEFLFNPVSKFSDRDFKRIRLALLNLEDRVDTWFSQEGLSAIQTIRWVELSRKMGVNPPDKLIQALDLIHRFNFKSDGKSIHPTFFIRLYKNVQKFQQDLLEVIPHYMDLIAHGKCQERAGMQVQEWTQCIPQDLTSFMKRSEVIRRALKAKNLKNGIHATPFDGSLFARISMYHVIAGEIIDVFDNTNSSESSQFSLKKRSATSVLSTDGQETGATSGLSSDQGQGNAQSNKKRSIKADMNNENDEVVGMMKIGLDSYETVHGFIENMKRKVKGLPFLDVDTLNPIRNFDPRDIARLITMATDVLVQPEPQKKNALKDLAAIITNVSPGSSVELDQDGITAILTLMDTLSDYRKVYMDFFAPVKTLDFNQMDYVIPRKELERRLPEMLQAEFPRTYESCQAFGYEWSCGLALSQIVPAAKRGPEYVNEFDLDLITIIAATAEGLVDSCDVNDDGLLKWKLWNGDDELDCGFVRVKDMVKRLIDADIISAKPSLKWQIDAALEVVNSLMVTRTIGKVALVKGSTRSWTLNLPFFAFYNGATLGSIYGLMSDVMDKEKARDLRKKGNAARKKKQKEQATNKDEADEETPSIGPQTQSVGDAQSLDPTAP